MCAPRSPRAEAQRLAALHSYSILDTPPEPAFDDIAQLAAQLAGTPTAFVCLIDEKRQWFKARVGIDMVESPREFAFCGDCILGRELIEVPDATLDHRFKENPFVVGPPHLRFYCGAPIITPDGHPLGTVAVMDTQPRHLTDSQHNALNALARQAATQLEWRRQCLKQQQAREDQAEHRREVERSLALLFSNLPGLVYRCANDEDWTAEFMSDGALSLTGYPPEDFVQRRVSLGTLIHPDDRAYVYDQVQRAAATRQAYHLKYRLCTADGGEKWVWEQGAGVYDSEGKMIALEGFISDVTERQRAEEEATREREFSEAVVNILPGVFYILDHEGRFMRWNHRMEQVSGYSAEELAGMPALRLFSGVEAEIAQAKIAEVVTRGEAEVELNLVSKTGNSTPFYFTARKIPSGEHYCQIGMGIDITKRRQAEEEVRESEERLRLLFENSSDLINILDEDCIIRFQSPSVERVLGYKVEERLGCKVTDTLHPDELPRVGVLVRKALAAPGIPLSAEFRCRHKDGSWRILESVGSAIPNRSGKRLFILTSRDVTENRRTAEQLRQSQKLEAIGQLSGGIAHDFNNILTIIQGQASLLISESGLQPRVQEALHEITDAATRAANLTRQLLTFSRRQPVELLDMDLNDAVGRTTRMLHRILREDISLKVICDQQPLIIHADASMLDQILLNLAVNARDAMPNGGELLIETSARELSPDEAGRTPGSRAGKFVCLRVKDTGVGISAQDLPRIFDPFFTTKEVGKGTGLGLSTVYGIVEQHSGWLRVDSELGRGTEFEIWLPRVASAKPQPKHTPGSLEQYRGTETILIVEDEASVRAVVSKFLRRLGYRVIEAHDGEAAMALWDQHKHEIQLLLADLVMPGGMSGTDVGRQLRSQAPGLKVIFSSGYSDELAHKEISLAPGIRFVPKPYPPARMARAVRELLDSNG